MHDSRGIEACVCPWPVLLAREIQNRGAPLRRDFLQTRHISRALNYIYPSHSFYSRHHYNSHEPLCNAMWRITPSLWDKIHHFASFPQTGVSLQQMVLFGQNPSQGTMLKASQFLTGELCFVPHFKRDN